MTTQTPVFDSDDPYFDAPFVDVDEWRDAPVRHRYVHGGFDGHRDPLLDLPPAGRSSTRAGSSSTSRRCRTARTSPRARSARRTRSGSRSPAAPTSSRPTAVGHRAARARRRSDDRGVPGQRGGGAVLAGRRGGDVRRAPALRLRVRRQRWRVPHDRRRREHHRRVGRRSSRTSSGRRWPSRTCSPCACTRSGSCATASTGSSMPSSPAGAATCSRGSTPRSATRSPR